MRHEEEEGIAVAIRYYTQAMKLNPLYAPAAVNLAELLFAEKRFGEVEALLSGVLESNDMNPRRGEWRDWREMIVRLATVLDIQGAALGNTTALQRGYDLATKILRLYPDEHRALMVEGNVLYRTGRFKEAASQRRERA